MKFVEKLSPAITNKLLFLSVLLVNCGLAGIFAFPGTAQACGNEVPPVGSELCFPLAYGDRPTTDQLLMLGRKIFFDPTLSASGKLSCASCHSQDHAYGPPNSLAVQLGGINMNRMGFRNTPSLRYLHSTIKFTEHFYEAEVTGGRDDEGPTGGHTWDGRANTGHEQALMPLLDQNEMANASVGEILERLRKTSYAEEFSRIVSAPGENVFDNPDVAIGWLSVAIEAFEQSPSDFHPFTSKYDAYLRDQVVLSAKEQRGLELFNDMKKGNCAGCHPDSHKNASSHLPIFTDFGYMAIGAPRNKALPANADPAFYDMGLCGPLRGDLKNKTEYCGFFRTPTLRNVTLRKNYFHNGVFHTLKQVMEFYVSRDITPEKWYPRTSDGKVDKFDDLPPQYRKNIAADPPFAPLPGNKPRLTSSEINDIIAFLNTLTDGYVVQSSGKVK